MHRFFLFALTIAACNEVPVAGQEVVDPGQPATAQTKPAQLPPRPAPARAQAPAAGADCPKCECTLGEVQGLRRELIAAERRIAELSATPDAVYVDLRRMIDVESANREHIEKVLAAIASFRKRFPGSPQAKLLLADQKTWEAMKVEVIKREDEQKLATAVNEIVSRLGVVEDGDEFAAAPAVRVGDYFKANGIKFDQISRLPKTAFEEAMKDPDSERGKALVFKGTVVQIRKEDEYFTGQMCTAYCRQVVSFMTPGATKGIVEDKTATFAGVVTQRFTYSNAGGGSTHSVFLVGYFKGQE